MEYSYDNVIKVIKNIEEEVLFDVEAPIHWYEIEFKDDKLIIYEIDKYHFDGDEWGTIDSKKNQTIIKEFECSLKEFTNFTIQFYQNLIQYMKIGAEPYPYSQITYILEKIIIRGIKND